MAADDRVGEARALPGAGRGRGPDADPAGLAHGAAARRRRRPERCRRRGRGGAAASSAGEGHERGERGDHGDGSQGEDLAAQQHYGTFLRVLNATRARAL